MHPGITPIIKERVIEDWFLGLKRDDIASKHLIGTGTVTRIVREWIAGFEGEGIADAMRYFAVTFRKLKLTIPDCVLGARNVAMLNNLGIERNDFEEFISETYKFLKNLGVDPKKMANCIKQMQDLTGTRPIAEIPQFISELDAKKKQLSQEIEDLKAEELAKKANVYILREKATELGYEFQKFDDIKLELEKYGLKLNDLESFAQTVKEAKELGYDAHLIGSKLRYWDELQKKELELAESVLKLEQKKEILEQRISHFEAKQKYYSTHGY